MPQDTAHAVGLGGVGREVGGKGFVVGLVFMEAKGSATRPKGMHDCGAATIPGGALDAPIKFGAKEVTLIAQMAERIDNVVRY